MGRAARSLLWFVMVPLPVAYGLPTALGIWLPVNAPLPGLWRVFGGILVAVGTTGLFACFLDFVRRGRGTPAPYEPPQNLVAVGLYRFSRNPMYTSALITIIGEGFLWASWAIFGYAALLGLALHLWVATIEEPKLRDRFGDQYERYSSTVPRWVGSPRGNKSA